jgi:hypothetical protein
MTTEATQEQSLPEENQQTNTPQPEAGTDLNISDLNALKNIIDVATQRGAFKAAELEAVGKVYNRLSGFLESVSKKG